MKFGTHHKSVLLGGAALLALASAPTTAWAQDVSEDQADEDRRRLSTVTVTATRREASIQDVPIAVSAFDPEVLEAQGVRDITNLSSVSASFNLQSSQSESGGTSIRLRGVGTTGNNIGLESSVAVFIDGVFLSRPGIALGDLLDLEQLEVLRGPQGTLFGRNTSAGALNITTRKPNLQEYEGFANFSYGNRDFFNVQAGASVPIIEDVLAARFSGSFRVRDGFLENDTLGVDSNDRDRFALRGQLLFEPTDNISFRFIGSYEETSEECCDAVIISDLLQTTPASLEGDNVFEVLGPVPSTGVVDPTGGAPFVGFGALDDRDTNAEQFENPVQQWSVSGQLDWDLGFGVLTYIGAFRDFESESVQESDFTGLNVFSVGGSTAEFATLDGPIGTGFIDTDFFGDDITAAEIAALPTTGDVETQTHEVRIQGTAFNDRVDWLFGGFYSDEDIDSQGSLTFGLDADFLAAANVPFAAFGPTPLADLTDGIATPTGAFAFNRFTQFGSSYSIFTHNTISVTDRFDFTFGVRFVDETKDGNFDNFAGQSDACAAIIGGIDAGLIPTAAFGLGLGVGCFPFTVVPNLALEPSAAFGGAVIPVPQTFSDNADEEGLFVEDFSDEEVVWTLKGSYQFTDNINGYISFTHGFKSGGFNLDASAASGGVDPRFDSEEIDAFEIGIKAALFDGRARANLAFFNQKIDDFQVLEFTGTQFTTFNVDEAISTGLELEIEAQVLDQLTLTSSITYADARFPTDCATPDDIGSAQALCGFDLTNAPEFVGVWGATWQDNFALFGQELNYFGNVNVRYETDRRTSTQGFDLDGGISTGILNPFDEQDANTKVNVRVGLGRVDGLWQIEGWATNIGDVQTRSITFNVPIRNDIDSRGAFIDAPREYGLTIRTQF